MNSTSTSPKSQPDWARVDALRDEDIDFSDCPEITAEMLANAELRFGGKPVESQEKRWDAVEEDRE